MPRKVSSGPLTMTLSLAAASIPQGGTLSGDIVVEVSGKEAFHFRSLFLDFDGTESNSVKDDQGEFDAFLNDFTGTRTYLHRRATPAGQRDATREDAEAAEQLRLELLFREHHTAPYARAIPWKPPAPVKKSGKKGDPAPPATEQPQTTQAASDSPPVPSPTTEFSPREGHHTVPGCSAADEPIERTDAPALPGTLHNEEEGVYGGMARDRFLPGRYSFPFSFTIPPWMPPSLYYRAGHLAYGEIRYRVVATLDVPGPVANLHLEETFFVLSTLSKRQLLAARQEAADTATIAPLPPLSAQFQVFRSAFCGNFCCLDEASAVEVEVALQCSRALLLTDTHGHVEAALKAEAQEATAPPQSQEDECAQGNRGARTRSRGYDAFTQRRPPGTASRPRSVVSPSAAVPDTKSIDGSDSSASCGYPADVQAARRRVLESLPAPVGTLPLVVRVDNRCVGREISRVRVELREVIRLFKSLEAPYTFSHPLARYDYVMSIPPMHEATFPVSLTLPTQFRRCREDPDTLLPPPGVRTANFATQTLIVVSFPDLHVYTEEEDWTVGAVHLAEALDLSDGALELPASYS